MKASWRRTSWPTRPATCCSRTGRFCAPRTGGGRGPGAPRCPARAPRVGTFAPTDIAFTSPAEGDRCDHPGPPLQDDGCGRVVDAGARGPGSDPGRPLRHPAVGLAVGSQPRAAHRERWSDVGTAWRTDRLVAHPLRGHAHLRRHDAVRPVADADHRRRSHLHLGQPLLDEAARVPRSLPAVGSSRRARTASPRCRTTPASPGRRSGRRLSQTFTRIRAVSASLVFAVGPNGTLARTSDGGRSWSPLGVSTSEDVIDVSFADAFVGYAVDAAGTVLRTENGGVSWQILNTGYSATPQAVLALDPRTVLLIGGRGVLRSTDGGDTFSRVRARIVAAARLFNVDRAGGRVFAYGSKNIVASSDRGRTWKKVLQAAQGAARLARLRQRADRVRAGPGRPAVQDAQRRAPLARPVRRSAPTTRPAWRSAARRAAT